MRAADCARCGIPPAPDSLHGHASWTCPECESTVVGGIAAWNERQREVEDERGLMGGHDAREPDDSDLHEAYDRAGDR